MITGRLAAMAVLAALWCGAAATSAGAEEPGATPVPAECLGTGVDVAPSTAFPNVVKAMAERKKIVVLAIGGSGLGGRGYRSGDYFGLVESFLEKAFKGLDVTIVQRGVSGEMARDAAERIKLETARAQPDVVFWQVGTADALAGVDPVEISETVRDTIRWLREHDVDTVLIGLHYSRALARDPHYQAVRAALGEVAKSENVLKVSRYEVMETLAKLQQGRSLPATEAELTATGYDCMAEVLARSLATGIFGRQKPVPHIKSPAPR